MSLITDLSIYLSVPILCEWLWVNDLVLIDSAICNKKDRVLFLNIVHHPQLKYKELLSITLFHSKKWLSIPNLNFNIFQLNLVHESWASIDVKSPSFNFLDNLKSFNIEEGSVLRRSICLDLISTTKSLTYLNLGKCRFVNDTVIFSIANNCGQLKTFLCMSENYVNCHIHDESILQLTTQCVFLEVLHLGNCIELTDKIGIAISENCGYLLNLALCNLPKLTDETIHTLIHSTKSKCIALTDLYVCNCVRFTDRGINYFFYGFKLLVNITIIVSHPKDWYGADTYYSVIAFDSHKLESVRLIGYKTTERVLKKLSSYNKSLRELMLIGDKHNQKIMVYPNGYEHIAKLCFSLEKLTLGNCSTLDEDHLVAIIKGCGAKLAYLSITPKFSDSLATIDAIGNHCKRLTTLNLSKMRLYSSFIDIITKCQVLTSLDMSSRCSFHKSFDWVSFISAILERNELKNLYFSKSLINKEEIKVLKLNCEKNVLFV
jgi:hypothetical protein